MHGEVRIERAARLTGHELSGHWIADRLRRLSRELRQLLCHQGMVVRQLLQKLMLLMRKGRLQLPRRPAAGGAIGARAKTYRTEPLLWSPLLSRRG